MTGYLHYYILFQNHTDATAMYRSLKGKKMYAQISPTPRELSVCCGVSLLVHGEDVDRIKEIAGDEKLDEEKGIICSPPNLPGWDDIRITEMLTQRFGVPAYMRNDANACALAEWRYGAGKGTKNMAFLTFGTGMGSGLILNGALYSGTNGNAGEVGHIRLAPKGPVGYGKAGSFEGFCSGGGMAQLGKTLAEKYLKQGGVLPYKTEDITAKLLAEQARLGDPVANEVFKISGEKLGAALSVLIDILNLEAIVIGSVYARCEDLLKPHAERVIFEEALLPSRQVCRLLPAALSENIGDIAALTVAAEGLRNEKLC